MKLWVTAVLFISMAMTLEAREGLPNESRESCVHAASYWAETGLMVRKAHTYRIDVIFPQKNGDPSLVRDAFISIRNLNGWPASIKRTLATTFFFWARRRPFDPWFALTATVDRRHPFRITHNGQLFTAPASGELVCYFNDTCWAYGNNHGAARLRLTPTPPHRTATTLERKPS